jgi:thiol:disulfide interchange protein DsbD
MVHLKETSMKQILQKSWILILLLSFQIFNSQAADDSIESINRANADKPKFLAEEEEPEFLTRDEAFMFSADYVDDAILVRWKIADNYYLYKNRFVFKAENATLGEAQFPQGKMHYDEFFNQTLEVFYNFIEVQIPVSNVTGPIKFSARSQGCTEGLCYTPYTKKVVFETGIVGTEKSDQQNSSESSVQQTNSGNNENASISDFATNQQVLADFLGDSNLLTTLGLFVLLGLLLTFTPCVFPMMPIIASIIAGQGKQTTVRKSFWLSFVYVQGMAITYVGLGVLTASVGHSLAAYFQSVWVVGVASIIFVLLALSMFGFYELKLPESMQSKLSNVSNQQSGGTFVGVAVMGMISALIVSPCMTAPLAGVLIHIAETGDYLLGGLYMYALAMGIGVPLIIIGVSEGKLMPKAGSWMDGVKSAFGVGLLAVAIIISDHLLPGSVVLVLWGILMLVSGVYLGAFEPHHDTDWNKFWKAIGLVLVIAGVIMFIGAARGNSNPLKPLEQKIAYNEVSSSTDQHGLPFVQVSSIEEIMSQVKQANAAGKTVMLDLYADWCAACEELASLTFPKPAVRNALSNTVWLQADVGDDADPESLRIMKQFNVIGLPSVMFFNKQGKEQTKKRVLGFLTEDDFVKRVDEAFK